jgi:hypothetical protein
MTGENERYLPKRDVAARRVPRKEANPVQGTMGQVAVGAFDLGVYRVIETDGHGGYRVCLWEV